MTGLLRNPSGRVARIASPADADGFRADTYHSDTYLSVHDHAASAQTHAAELDAMPRAMTEDQAAGSPRSFLNPAAPWPHRESQSAVTSAALLSGEELPVGLSAPRCYWPESVINATGEVSGQAFAKLRTCFGSKSTNSVRS